MTKVRVYELAKELGMPSKQLAEQLVTLGFPVKNHMSTMDVDTAQKAREHYTKPKMEEENVIVKQDIEEKEKEKSKKLPASKKKTAKTGRGQKQTGKDDVASDDKDAKKNTPAVKKSLPEQSHLRGKRKKQDKAEAAFKKARVEGRVTVRQLADALEITSAKLITFLMSIGILANINQELEEDVMQLAAEEMGYKLQVAADPQEEKALGAAEEEAKPEDLQGRPPVVTVLGHVDHGKTSLLDSIRRTKVTDSEAGGITQHIGASSIVNDGREIIFLDTPGHEAFTAMRARGAQITDIAILVVAADDGVMPQTVEAINHVKAAGVPLIVALNKIDKPDANPDRVKQQLTEHGLVTEEWGGETIVVPVSALKGEGIEELLEMILLVADMQELKANPDQPARGTVIEAKLDKGRGSVATVLVQNGTLRIGNAIVCGTIYGKVRAMTNEQGNRIKEAGPSTPVEIIGLSDVPLAGDTFLVASEDKLARQISEKRQGKEREVQLKRPQISLEDIFKQLQEGEVKQLNLIIKADVQGSVEALRDSILKMHPNDEVKIDIIHEAVGAVTESDVMLASASDAVIIGFNVRPEPSARKMAEKENIDIRLYRIIYEVLDDLGKAVKGMLTPKLEEIIEGQVEVRQTYNVSKIGTIAGCHVKEGKIRRNSGVRLFRDSKIIYEGKISSLKRFKDDAKEVVSGYDCGITLENFNDIKVGDIIEAFTEKVVEQGL